MRYIFQIIILGIHVSFQGTYVANGVDQKEPDLKSLNYDDVNKH